MMAWKDVDPKSVPPWQERHVRGLIDKFKEMGGESRAAALARASAIAATQYKELGGDLLERGAIQGIGADVSRMQEFRDYNLTVNEILTAARIPMERSDVDKQGKPRQVQLGNIQQVIDLTGDIRQAIMADPKLGGNVQYLVDKGVSIMTNMWLGGKIAVDAFEREFLDLSGWDDVKDKEGNVVRTAQQVQAKFLKDYGDKFWDVSATSSMQSMLGLLTYKVARMLDKNGRLSDQDIANARAFIGDVSKWTHSPTGFIGSLLEVEYRAKREAWYLRGANGPPPVRQDWKDAVAAKLQEQEETSPPKLKPEEEDAFQSVGTP